MGAQGAQRSLLALGALIVILAPIVTAAPTLSESTELDVYDGAGCYYNFQHYGEGDRIMTNEPCLNCTCHNRMLMCYLRVCPFTKPIGQDCTVEKRGDQCCPIITCPDVPVDLMTATTSSPSVYSTEVGHHDTYGCSIDNKFYSDGARVPSNPNKPCELCYCIRNMTACVMQECTLHVEGCTPVYQKEVCCPVRYSCDHPESDEPLQLDYLTTTVRPTPGFLLTTTLPPGYTSECSHRNETFADGAFITTDEACEHCYCMKGDIVCAVQECGTPMENEGKNCTAMPAREGQCCPDTYICEGDEEITTTSEDLTTSKSDDEGQKHIRDHTVVSDEATKAPVHDKEVTADDESTTVAHDRDLVTQYRDEKGDEEVKEGEASTARTSIEDEHKSTEADSLKTPAEDESSTEKSKPESETTLSDELTHITESYDDQHPDLDVGDHKKPEHVPTERYPEKETTHIDQGEETKRPEISTDAPHSDEKEQDESSEDDQHEIVEKHPDVTKSPDDITKHPDDATKQPEDVTKHPDIGKIPDSDEKEHEYSSEHPSEQIDEEEEKATPKYDDKEYGKPTEQSDIEKETSKHDEEETRKSTVYPEVEKETPKYDEEDTRKTTGYPEPEKDTPKYDEQKPEESDKFPDVEKETPKYEDDEVQKATEPTEVEKETPKYDDSELQKATEQPEIPKETSDYGEKKPEDATEHTDVEKQTPHIDDQKPEITESPLFGEHTTQFDEQKPEKAPEYPHIEIEPDHDVHVTTPKSLLGEDITTLVSADHEAEGSGDVEDEYITSVYRKSTISSDESESTQRPKIEITKEQESSTEHIPKETSPSGIEKETALPYSTDKPSIDHKVPVVSCTDNSCDDQNEVTDKPSSDVTMHPHDRFSSQEDITEPADHITDDLESIFGKGDEKTTEHEIQATEKPERDHTVTSEDKESTPDHDEISTERVQVTKASDDDTVPERDTESSEHDVTKSSSTKSDEDQAVEYTKPPSIVHVDDDLKETTIKPLDKFDDVTESDKVEKTTAIFDTGDAITESHLPFDQEKIDQEQIIPHPPRIPGEGNCFVDGVSYENGARVPTAGKCQAACYCLNSILKCEHVPCSPPPSELKNCQPMYHGTESCCPAYICEQDGAPVIIPDSQIFETTPKSGVTEQIDETTPHAYDHTGYDYEKPDHDLTIPPAVDDVEKPIVPSVHVPDCGSDGCSIDRTKPDSAEGQIKPGVQAPDCGSGGCDFEPSKPVEVEKPVVSVDCGDQGCGGVDQHIPPLPSDEDEAHVPTTQKSVDDESSEEKDKTSDKQDEYQTTESGTGKVSKKDEEQEKPTIEDETPVDESQSTPISVEKIDDLSTKHEYEKTESPDHISTIHPHDEIPSSTDKYVTPTSDHDITIGQQPDSETVLYEKEQTTVKSETTTREELIHSTSSEETDEDESGEDESVEVTKKPQDLADGQVTEKIQLHVIDSSEEAVDESEEKIPSTDKDKTSGEEDSSEEKTDEPFTKPAVQDRVTTLSPVDHDSDEQKTEKSPLPSDDQEHVTSEISHKPDIGHTEKTYPSFDDEDDSKTPAYDVEKERVTEKPLTHDVDREDELPYDDKESDKSTEKSQVDQDKSDEITDKPSTERQPTDDDKVEAVTVKEPTPFDKDEQVSEKLPTYDGERVTEKLPTHDEDEQSSEKVPAYDEEEKSSEKVPTHDEEEQSSEKVPALDEEEQSSEKVPALDKEEQSSEKAPAHDDEEQITQKAPTHIDEIGTTEKLPESSQLPVDKEPITEKSSSLDDDEQPTEKSPERDDTQEQITEKILHDVDEDVTVKSHIDAGETDDVEKYPHADRDQTTPKEPESVEDVHTTDKATDEATTKSTTIKLDSVDELKTTVSDIESHTPSEDEEVTARVSEITTVRPVVEKSTVSSDDVNKIGVSVLPTDVVEEDCGSSGCVEQKPVEVSPEGGLKPDLTEGCGDLGCQVETSFTGIPKHSTEKPSCESEDCQGEDVEVQTPKTSDCGPHGCEGDDQENLIGIDTDCQGPNCVHPSIHDDESDKKPSHEDCGPSGCQPDQFEIPDCKDDKCQPGTQIVDRIPVQPGSENEIPTDDCGVDGCGALDVHTGKPITSDCGESGCEPAPHDEKETTEPEITSQCDSGKCDLPPKSSEKPESPEITTEHKVSQDDDLQSNEVDDEFTPDKPLVTQKVHDYTTVPSIEKDKDSQEDIKCTGDDCEERDTEDTTVPVKSEEKLPSQDCIGDRCDFEPQKPEVSTETIHDEGQKEISDKFTTVPASDDEIYKEKTTVSEDYIHETYTEKSTLKPSVVTETQPEIDQDSVTASFDHTLSPDEDKPGHLIPSDDHKIKEDEETPEPTGQISDDITTQKSVVTKKVEDESTEDEDEQKVIKPTTHIISTDDDIHKEEYSTVTPDIKTTLKSVIDEDEVSHVTEKQEDVTKTDDEDIHKPTDAHLPTETSETQTKKISPSDEDFTLRPVVGDGAPIEFSTEISKDKDTSTTVPEADKPDDSAEDDVQTDYSTIAPEKDITEKSDKVQVDVTTLRSDIEVHVTESDEDRDQYKTTVDHDEQLVTKAPVVDQEEYEKPGHGEEISDDKQEKETERPQFDKTTSSEVDHTLHDLQKETGKPFEDTTKHITEEIKTESPEVQYTVHVSDEGITSRPQLESDAHIIGEEPESKPTYGTKTDKPEYGAETEKPAYDEQEHIPEHDDKHTESPEVTKDVYYSTRMEIELTTPHEIEKPEHDDRTEKPAYDDQTKQPEHDDRTKQPEHDQTEKPERVDVTKRPEQDRTEKPEYDDVTKYPEQDQTEKSVHVDETKRPEQDLTEKPEYDDGTKQPEHDVPTEKPEHDDEQTKRPQYDDEQTEKPIVSSTQQDSDYETPAYEKETKKPISEYPVTDVPSQEEEIDSDDKITSEPKPETEKPQPTVPSHDSEEDEEVSSEKVDDDHVKLAEKPDKTPIYEHTTDKYDDHDQVSDDHTVVTETSTEKHVSDEDEKSPELQHPEDVTTRYATDEIEKESEKPLDEPALTEKPFDEKATLRPVVGTDEEKAETPLYDHETEKPVKEVPTTIKYDDVVETEVPSDVHIDDHTLKTTDDITEKPVHITTQEVSEQDETERPYHEDRTEVPSKDDKTEPSQHEDRTEVPSKDDKTEPPQHEEIEQQTQKPYYYPVPDTDQVTDKTKLDSDVSDERVTVSSKEPAHATEESIQDSEEQTQVPDRTVPPTERPVYVPDESTHVSEEPSDASEEPVHSSEVPTHAPEDHTSHTTEVERRPEEDYTEKPSEDTPKVPSDDSGEHVPQATSKPSLFTTTVTPQEEEEVEPSTKHPIVHHSKPPQEIPHDKYPPIDDSSEPEIPEHQAPDFRPHYGQEPDYDEEGEQAFGPGTCRYGGKVYVSAQQIPRDDPCDFCFCFRSDIICLQQSCPPPIQHCHEEPIQGFCCPRYECPVSMATVLNVTTTTTTTTTTLPPHFLSHAYKGAAQKRGCQIKGQAYKVGEYVRSASGPCLTCTCGGDGQMKCDPKVCTPEPMLRQMIAVAATSRRR